MDDDINPIASDNIKWRVFAQAMPALPAYTMRRAPMPRRFNQRLGIRRANSDIGGRRVCQRHSDEGGLAPSKIIMNHHEL